MTYGRRFRWVPLPSDMSPALPAAYCGRGLLNRGVPGLATYPRRGVPATRPRSSVADMWPALPATYCGPGLLNAAFPACRLIRATACPRLARALSSLTHVTDFTSCVCGPGLNRDVPSLAACCVVSTTCPLHIPHQPVGRKFATAVEGGGTD